MVLLGGRIKRLNPWLQFLLLLLFVYFFLVSIALMGASFKLMGKGFAESLIKTTANPLVGLFLGILVTSIVQSSSSTTSIVVAMVGAGILPITNAVPIVLGANIGTSVTNTIVSMGHITRRGEFRRAFSGAVVHDFFNFFAVAIFFPIEFFFHPLENTARALSESFYGSGGLTFVSPLKMIVTPLEEGVLSFFGSFNAPPAVVLVFSLIVLFVSLKFIVDFARSLVATRMTLLLDRYLFRNAATAFFLGLLFTVLVQSSSVTTSLIVPFVGAGLLSLEKIFPYMIGANIGTTVTALLASFAVKEQAALTIALVHLLFNCFAALILFPLRRVPIFAAKRFAEFVSKNRKMALVYLIIVFYLLPLTVILLLG